ncbi:MAG: GNAT family N-acetyltransferase [Sinobacteraceae bacterium]|nr:GNAT family N-acetyltransferase [Nevskiaceae bacterium]
MEPFAVRVATAADATALCALVNSAYRGDSSRAGWTTEADLLGGQRTDVAALEAFIRDGTAHGTQVMLLHEDATGPSCCVQLERRGDEAYLGMLTVRPQGQGAGRGRLLLEAAEQHVRQAWGARAVQMTVIEQRDELIAWYERRGYRRTGQTAPFPYGDLRFGEPKRADLRFVVLRKVFAEDSAP